MFSASRHWVFYTFLTKSIFKYQFFIYLSLNFPSSRLKRPSFFSISYQLSSVAWLNPHYPQWFQSPKTLRHLPCAFSPSKISAQTSCLVVMLVPCHASCKNLRLLVLRCFLISFSVCCLLFSTEWNQPSVRSELPHPDCFGLSH